MPKGVYPHRVMSALERLMRHVRKAPGDGCWLWMGARYRNGYGNFYLGRMEGRHVHMTAARAMWTLTKGPVPADLEIDHLCRVRACVNPDHLETVSHQENRFRGRGYKHVNPSRARRGANQ